MPIMAPGMFLSQPPTTITPSCDCPRLTVSMLSAITSRLTREHFMPSVPMLIPSDTVMVPYTCGIPPPSFSASVMCPASSPRPLLQGVMLLCACATPMTGFSKSPSPKPTARSIARFGARSMPCVT